VHKIPVGASFIGGNNADAKILSYGYAFERRTMLRAEPKYLKNAEAIDVISKAMTKK
jgi:amidase